MSVTTAHTTLSDAEAPLIDPGDAQGRESTPQRRSKAAPAPPRALTLLCGVCEKRIKGSGAGFAYVDLRDATAALRGHGARASWRLAHAACAPEVLRPLSPYAVVWVDRITTTDDLLDTLADLSRHPWLAGTAWGPFVQGVLADTDRADDQLDYQRTRQAQARERRKAEMADPDHPAHGTVSGYINNGCRCERCTDAQRQQRQDQNP